MAGVGRSDADLPCQGGLAQQAGAGGTELAEGVGAPPHCLPSQGCLRSRLHSSLHSLPLPLPSPAWLQLPHTRVPACPLQQPGLPCGTAFPLFSRPHQTPPLCPFLALPQVALQACCLSDHMCRHLGTGTEQELRTLTHEQDQTPSLEPTRAAGLNVGPKDHLQQDRHWAVKMPISGSTISILGLEPGSLPSSSCSLVVSCTWSLKTSDTLMGESD